MSETTTLRAEDIAYRLAPRLNAAGRLGCARLVVDLLTTPSEQRARDLAEFLESHERCFVVEQNRDGQLRSLLAIETGIARDRMTSVLDFGGLPLTAPIVVRAVTKQLEHAAV